MPARSTRRFYSPRRVLTVAAIIVTLALAYFVGQALAKRPEPVAAPSALLRARAQCPDRNVTCLLGALRKAYSAIEWQRRARNKASAGTSRDVVLDAINWASEKYHVAAWQMRSVGNCESHLFFLASNGQYLSWAQLSTRHRSDPIIQRLTWRDPYAVADHVARYVRNHGWGEWQCQPGGGLRW